MRNKVAHSIEAPGGAICVDIFERPDRSWGIEEYRRDAEDGRGWFMTGHLGERRFPNQQAALLAALKLIPWLEPQQIESVNTKT